MPSRVKIQLEHATSHRFTSRLSLWRKRYRLRRPDSHPSGGASAASIKHQVSQIPTGALIEVRFTDKSKLRGYLSEVEANGFGFRIGDPATGSLHTTTFGDVNSVKQVTNRHIPPAVWMAIGAGAVVIVVLIAGRHAL